MRTKLSNLAAHFIGAGGEGVFNADMTPAPERKGVGLVFMCPCGQKHDEYDLVYVQFRNPLDGGPQLDASRPAWQLTGETIDELTLTPSIQRNDPAWCKWHGFVTNGEAHE